MDTQAREAIERLTAKVEEQQAVIDALVDRTAEQDAAFEMVFQMFTAAVDASRGAFEVVEQREIDMLLRLTRLEQGR
jgi:hypothetical protein